MKRFEYLGIAKRELIEAARSMDAGEEFIAEVEGRLDRAAAIAGIGKRRPEFGDSDVLMFFVNKYRYTLVTAMIHGEARLSQSPIRAVSRTTGSSGSGSQD